MYASAVIAVEYAWSKYTIHNQSFTSNCFDIHNKSLLSDIIDRLIFLNRQRFFYPPKHFTRSHLQFCFANDKQAHICFSCQNSLVTAGSNITDLMIKINSYMSEKHLEPYIGP